MGRKLKKAIFRSRFVSLAGGISASQAFILLNSASLILTTPIILEGLGPEAYGINILAQQMVFYLGQLDFGFGGAMTRRLARVTEDEDFSEEINGVISSSCLVFGAMSLLVLVAGFVALPLVPDMFMVTPVLEGQMRDLIAVTLVLLAFQLILRPFTMLFFARQRQAIFHTLNGVPGLVIPWLTMFLVVNGFELYSFVISHICSSIITIGLTITLTRRHFPKLRVDISRINWKLVKELFRYGWYLFVITICGIVVIQSDRILIGAVLSITAVAAFSLSIRVPELAARLIDQIVVNLSPYLIELTHKNKSKEMIRRHYEEVAKVVLFVSIGANCALAVTVEGFVSAWVGPEYFFGTPALYAILVFKSLFSISLLNGSILNAQGRVRRMAWIACIEAILHVVFAVWWGGMLGPLGILLGGLVSHALTASIFNSVQVASLAGFKLSDLYLRPILLPIIGFPLAAFFVERLKIFGFGETGTWASFLCDFLLVIVVFISTALVLMLHPYYATLRNRIKGFCLSREIL